MRFIYFQCTPSQCCAQHCSVLHPSAVQCHGVQCRVMQYFLVAVMIYTAFHYCKIMSRTRGVATLIRIPWERRLQGYMGKCSPSLNQGCISKVKQEVHTYNNIGSRIQPTPTNQHPHIPPWWFVTYLLYWLHRTSVENVQLFHRVLNKSIASW